MANREQWKQDERDLAEWAGGVRHPSNGQVQQDLSGPWWTAEHKTFAALPARLTKAFEQAKENLRLEPLKVPFVFFTLHFGRGKRTRRFVAIEVDIKTDDFEIVGRDIENVREYDHVRTVEA